MPAFDFMYRESRRIHDARLVAAMKAHGVTGVLTFDRSGFSGFPGIEVINPADVKTI